MFQHLPRSKKPFPSLLTIFIILLYYIKIGIYSFTPSETSDIRYSVQGIIRHIYFKALVSLRERAYNRNSLEYINLTFIWYILALLMLL